MRSFVGPRRLVIVFAALLLIGLLLASADTPLAAGRPLPGSAQGVSPAIDPALKVAELLQGRLPVTAEHRYRIAGKVRLLLFWAGKDDVGSARMRWRGREGDTGYDLLIGSDPARAPRKLNRWGFIMEESVGGVATILGVMKKGQDETLEEATSNAAADSADGVVFDMIQATVNSAESVARVTSTRVSRDYSFRELVPLMEQLVRETAPPKERRVTMPTGGRQGLLLCLADLLHDAIEVVRTTSKPPGHRSLPYAYHRKQYNLARLRSSIERQATYGGVTHTRLLRSEYQITTRGESWTERFTIVCGTDGPFAGIPVFMSYQPRWWFKVELVLDERQGF